MTQPETLTATPRQRVQGDDRTSMGAQMAESYNGGLSIREVAEKHGRSYGAAHRMLQEAGVTLRRRGGRGKVA